MKRIHLITILWSVLLSGCVITAPTQEQVREGFYYKARPSLNLSSSPPDLSIACQDQRQDVVEGKKKTSFEGFQPGYMYIPKVRTTVTGQPLAVELRKILVKSLKDEYVKVHEVECNPNERDSTIFTRLQTKPVQNCMLVTIYKWQTDDGIKKCVFDYDVEVVIQNIEGKLVAKKRLNGKKTANTLGKKFPFDEYIKVYKDTFEQLFSDEAIRKGLSGE